jgi:putative addiction module component (TIGR02574 family)
MQVIDLPEISRLSTPEKILLIEDLWDSIAADAASVPVLPSHLAELDRRMQRHKASPDALLTLEELQARIDERK